VCELEVQGQVDRVKSGAVDALFGFDAFPGEPLLAA
jgi:hypothetical protein